jgi:hypothetical protein
MHFLFPPGRGCLGPAESYETMGGHTPASESAHGSPFEKPPGHRWRKHVLKPPRQIAPWPLRTAYPPEWDRHLLSPIPAGQAVPVAPLVVGTLESLFKEKSVPSHWEEMHCTPSISMKFWLLQKNSPKEAHTCVHTH